MKRILFVATLLAALLLAASSASAGGLDWRNVCADAGQTVVTKPSLILVGNWGDGKLESVIVLTTPDVVGSVAGFYIHGVYTGWDISRPDCIPFVGNRRPDGVLVIPINQRRHAEISRAGQGTFFIGERRTPGIFRMDGKVAMR